MKASELRENFLMFFKEKGHKIVDSSSLLPADPTCLFISAGMQQFAPYLSGEVIPPYKRACSVQKCVRVNDIEEVGDNIHHTFFEMLGNWSFNDYFKEQTIDWALIFLTEVCKIPKQRLWVTIFKGKEAISKDIESKKIWLDKGILEQRIFEFGVEDNFWGPVGKTGPCGPCSEIFYDITQTPCEKDKDCGPNCDCGRFVEIWNLVFMEYNKTIEGKFEKMALQNVDTGIGFERLLTLLQNKGSAYETDLFVGVIKKIEELANIKYEQNKRAFRIVAEHLRAILFITSEGVLPSNLDRGYVLRRLLRRAIVYAKKLGLKNNWHEPIIENTVENYKDQYPEIEKNEQKCKEIIAQERQKFEKTLSKAILKFDRILSRQDKVKSISGQDLFRIRATFGLPFEIIKEITEEKGYIIDKENKDAFDQIMEEHRRLSRAGAQKKFGGVGIEQIENEEEKQMATNLHTATHLLHQALREVLGGETRQMGSDITSERLRFDFSCPKKLTKQEIEKIEDIVNDKIEKGLIVEKQKMPYEEAIQSGALAFFKERYPQEVFVYIIKEESGSVFSKEICAGPHIKNTSILGKFKIIKEKSIGASLRRIKAILS